MYNIIYKHKSCLKYPRKIFHENIALTLTASVIFLVFCIKIKYFLILQAINKKISVECLITMNPRTPPGGVKTL